MYYYQKQKKEEARTERRTDPINVSLRELKTQHDEKHRHPKKHYRRDY